MAMMTQGATTECQEQDHIDFLWIQESILSALSAENLFQYEHFHEHLKWKAVCAKTRHCLVESSSKYMILF